MMVCFSCGHPGHGVNRCSRMDTSFPLLPQGWSVDVRDGQYQAVWPGGVRAWSRGMVQAGVSVSRIIGDQGTTDPGGGESVSGRGQPAWQLPVGHEHGPSWASSTQAFPPLGSHPAKYMGRITEKFGPGPVDVGKKESDCA